MEDIKVGEYVRTKTKIGQIILIKNENKHWKYIVKFRNRTTHIDRYSIAKHSFNLTDLLEVGDIVNGYRVHKITSACIYFTGKAVQNKLTINIATILTHEQFEANCYTVKSSTIN